MNIFGRRSSQKKSGGSKTSSPSPNVYKERSAIDFQAEELKRLQGKESTEGEGADSRSKDGTSDSASTVETRDQRFVRLKKTLETALRNGDTDKIIEGYRNLGQHFMQGKSLAEQQAAKQMFEKALEHAGVTSPDKGASGNEGSKKISENKQHYVSQASTMLESNGAADQGGSKRIVLELTRAPLPGMALAPDGLAGVGFSFEMQPDGSQLISTLAPTGSAAQSGRIQEGDILISVDHVKVSGMPASEIIRRVKGQPGSRVVLEIESFNQDHNSPNKSNPETKIGSPRTSMQNIAEAVNDTNELNYSSQHASPNLQSNIPAAAPAESPTLPTLQLPAAPPKQETMPTQATDANESFSSPEKSPKNSVVHNVSVQQFLQEIDPPKSGNQELARKESNASSSQQALQSPQISSSQPTSQSPLHSMRTDNSGQETREQNSNMPNNAQNGYFFQGQPPNYPFPLTPSMFHPSQPFGAPFPFPTNPFQPQQYVSTFPPNIIYNWPQMQQVPPNVEGFQPSWQYPVPNALQPEDPSGKLMPPEPSVPAPQVNMPTVGMQPAGSNASTNGLVNHHTGPAQTPVVPTTVVTATNAVAKSPETSPLSSKVLFDPPKDQSVFQAQDAASDNHSAGGKRKGKRLVLTRESARGQVILPEQRIGIGLNLSAKKGNQRAPFIVESMVPDSPAARCNQISVGDILYSIDGVRVKEKTLSEVIQMLQGPVGSQLVVVFQLKDSTAAQNHGANNGNEESRNFVVQFEVISADGLPTSPTTDTGLYDPYCCVSILSDCTESEENYFALNLQPDFAQYTTSIQRKTLNPFWNESFALNDMYALDNSSREFSSQRIPLSGSAVTLVFSIFSDSKSSGSEFVGLCKIRNFYPGTSTESNLFLLDKNGNERQFSGIPSILNVKLSYHSSHPDEHQLQVSSNARLNGTAFSTPIRKDWSQPGATPVNDGALTKTQLEGKGRRSRNPTLSSQKSSHSSDRSLAALWVSAHPPLQTKRFLDMTREIDESDGKSDAWITSPIFTSSGSSGIPVVDQHASLSKKTSQVSEPLRRELESKDKQISGLRAENSRLMERIQEISLMNETSLESSHTALQRMREELDKKTDKLKNLQYIVDNAGPAQKRLEEQLAAAQQLVRGSMLQHDKFEEETQKKDKEIESLRREKELLEKELQACKIESFDKGGSSREGSNSLHELIDVERRKFKKALADERARAADALERERAKHENVVKDLEMTHAAQQRERSSNGDLFNENVELQKEISIIRAALEREKEKYSKLFSQMHEELALLKRQASSNAADMSERGSNSVVKTWYRGGQNEEEQSKKISRLEASLSKVTTERDKLKFENESLQRAAEDKEQKISSQKDSDKYTMQLEMDKKQAIQELREYEMEVERLHEEKEKLRSKLSDTEIETEELRGRLRTMELTRTSSKSTSGNDLVEELEHKLKEKEKAYSKLQKEHKRLQILAAGRSSSSFR